MEQSDIKALFSSPTQETLAPLDIAHLKAALLQYLSSPDSQ